MAVLERTKLGQFGAKMCQIFGERQVATSERLESTSIQLDVNVFKKYRVGMQPRGIRLLEREGSLTCLPGWALFSCPFCQPPCSVPLHGAGERGAALRWSTSRAFKVRAGQVLSFVLNVRTEKAPSEQQGNPRVHGSQHQTANIKHMGKLVPFKAYMTTRGCGELAVGLHHTLEASQ